MSSIHQVLHEKNNRKKEAESCTHKHPERRQGGDAPLVAASRRSEGAPLHQEASHQEAPGGIQKERPGGDDGKPRRKRRRPRRRSAHGEHADAGGDEETGADQAPLTTSTYYYVSMSFICQVLHKKNSRKEEDGGSRGTEDQEEMRPSGSIDKIGRDAHTRRRRKAAALHNAHIHPSGDPSIHNARPESHADGRRPDRIDG